jgi:broad specificity phosphatase PhoE
LVLFALLGVTTTVNAQQVVYIVRHAEQRGMAEDTPLTEVGQRRAHGLATILEHSGITAIYTSELRRTRQTAEPLADALGLRIRQVPRTDTGALVRQIQQEHPDGRVLIVGHTQTIPLILRGFGHPDEVTVDMSDYDNLFFVVRDASAQPVLIRLRFTLTAEAGSLE